MKVAGRGPSGKSASRADLLSEARIYVKSEEETGYERIWGIAVLEAIKSTIDISLRPANTLPQKYHIFWLSLHTKFIIHLFVSTSLLDRSL